MRLSLVLIGSASLMLAMAEGCVASPDKLTFGNGDSRSSGSGPSGSSGTGAGQGGDAPGGAGAGGGSTSSAGGGGGASGGASGLPCDVAALLGAHCTQCHTNPPVAGAHTSLKTYEDLVAAMPGDPSKKVGEVALERMKDATRPMPPGGLLPAADVNTFAAWVNAGMPATGCNSTGSGGGGAGAGGGSGGDPYNTPPVCTSMRYWTSGNSGSGDMLPGKACIACHARSDAPAFQIAGTVYPTAHEPDSCDGAGNAQVEITDANGQVTTLSVRGSGNFYTRAAMALPVKARVLYNGKSLAMASPIHSGDCNTCHTQNGANGAPGRIILPP